MATSGIKGGDLIHVGGGVLLDRLQTAGPSQPTQNATKEYELGNRSSIDTVYDRPVLSFPLTSYDVSGQLERIIVGGVYAGRNVTDAAITSGDATLTSATGGFTEDDVRRKVTVAGAGAGGDDLVAIIESVTDAHTAELNVPAGTTVSDAHADVAQGAFDMSKAQPLDIAAQFLDTSKNSKAGAVVPFLTLDSYSIKVGVKASAELSASFTSDAVYYGEGSAFTETFTGTGAAGQVVALTHTALLYTGDALDGDKYALSVTAAGDRLFYGSDYTEVVTGSGAAKTVELHLTKPVATTDKIAVAYLTDVEQTYPDYSHAAVTAVRPSTVRGDNIRVLLGGTDLTALWSMIQTAQIDYKSNLTAVNELGNSNTVAQDAAVPDVSGNIVMMPRNVTELFAQIRKAVGVADGEVIGPNTHAKLPLYVLIYSPSAPNTVLKTYEVPDAEFVLPGYGGQVNATASFTFNFTSASGDLFVYEGLRPGLTV